MKPQSKEKKSDHQPICVLLKAKRVEIIFWKRPSPAFCSELFMKSDKWEEKERRENVYLDYWFNYWYTCVNFSCTQNDITSKCLSLTVGLKNPDNYLGHIKYNIMPLHRRNKSVFSTYQTLQLLCQKFGEGGNKDW